MKNAIITEKTKENIIKVVTEISKIIDMYDKDFITKNKTVKEICNLRLKDANILNLKNEISEIIESDLFFELSLPETVKVISNIILTTSKDFNTEIEKYKKSYAEMYNTKKKTVHLLELSIHDKTSETPKTDKNEPKLNNQ